MKDDHRMQGVCNDADRSNNGDGDQKYGPGMKDLIAKSEIP